MPAYAFTLGAAKVNSHINQKLDAEIEVLSIGKVKVEKLRAFLATKNDFKKFDIERESYLEDIRFTTYQEESGRTYIHLTSGKIIREPLISLVVTMRSLEGNISREYNLFLNPPPETRIKPATVNTNLFTDDDSQYTDNSFSEKSLSSKDYKNPNRKKHPVGKFSVPGIYRPDLDFKVENYQPVTSYGPIKPGELLTLIVQDIRPDDTYAIQKISKLLFQYNPDAFKNGDINKLKVGSMLKIPALNQPEFRKESLAYLDNGKPQKQQNLTGDISQNTNNELTIDSVGRTVQSSTNPNIDNSDAKLTLLADDLDSNNAGSDTQQLLKLSMEKVRSLDEENKLMKEQFDLLVGRMEEVIKRNDLLDKELKKLRSKNGLADHTPAEDLQQETADNQALTEGIDFNVAKTDKTDLTEDNARDSNNIDQTSTADTDNLNSEMSDQAELADQIEPPVQSESVQAPVKDDSIAAVNKTVQDITPVESKKSDSAVTLERENLQNTSRNDPVTGKSSGFWYYLLIPILLVIALAGAAFAYIKKLKNKETPTGEEFNLVDVLKKNHDKDKQQKTDPEIKAATELEPSAELEQSSETKATSISNDTDVTSDALQKTNDEPEEEILIEASAIEDEHLPTSDDIQSLEQASSLEDTESTDNNPGKDDDLEDVLGLDDTELEDLTLDLDDLDSGYEQINASIPDDVDFGSLSDEVEESTLAGDSLSVDDSAQAEGSNDQKHSITTTAVAGATLVSSPKINFDDVLGPARSSRSADNVDLISQSSVYFAYGKFDLAEQLLKDGIEKDSDNTQLKLKLFECYAKMDDESKFMSLLEQEKDTYNQDNDFNQKLQEMYSRHWDKELF